MCVSMYKSRLNHFLPKKNKKKKSSTEQKKRGKNDITAKNEKLILKMQQDFKLNQNRIIHDPLHREFFAFIFHSFFFHIHFSKQLQNMKKKKKGKREN